MSNRNPGFRKFGTPVPARPERSLPETDKTAVPTPSKNEGGSQVPSGT
jgi:hypothetical protein